MFLLNWGLIPSLDNETYQPGDPLRPTLYTISIFRSMLRVCLLAVTDLHGKLQTWEQCTKGYVTFLQNSIQLLLNYFQTLHPRFLMNEPSEDVDRCVGEGETCLFRGGLVGAAVKLNCCPGSKCVFYGNSFQCAANRYEIFSQNSPKNI